MITTSENMNERVKDYLSMNNDNISKYALGLGTSFIKSGHVVDGIKFLIMSVYYDKKVMKNYIVQKLTIYQRN